MARPDRSFALSSLLLASLAAVTSAPEARAATLGFAPAVTYATGGAAGNEPRSVAVGDFNGDGRPDLAHTNFLGGVSVRLNDGTGAFPTSTTYGAGSEPNAVAVGDLNGDSKLDLAVANRSGSSVSVLLGNGDGTFVAAVNFSTGAFGSNPYSVAVGDLNADGRLDLAVANVGTDNVAVLLNTAPTGAAVPSFAAHVDFAVGDGPFSVAIGDLSGDGRPDLVTANEYNDTVSVLVSSTAAGAAVPSFAAHVAYAAADGPLSVALGLLNADGSLDVAAANIFAGRNVSVLVGNGDGTLAAATNYPLPTTAGSPYAVRTGDFDGDGNLDLATANFNGPSASVLLGDGSGTFSVGGTYPTGSSPYSVAVGDFNGDGKPDLVTSNFFGTIDGRPSLSVLLNTSASAPTIAKVFVPDTVALGQPSTLTFTLVNPNPTIALTGIDFTDTLPSNLVVASPPGVTSTCGGIVSATAGSGAINLMAGTLAGGASCTIGVNVSSAVAGTYNNTSGPISATQTGAGTTSNTAILVVVGPPAITKAFGATSIPLNGSTWLEFTIFNLNASTALTGVGFTDALPAGLVVATPNGLWGSCGGAVTAVSGSSSVSLTGGTLLAASTCAISVNVVGTSPGVKDNSVTVSSTEGGTGNTTTASLTVAAPPGMTKAFGAAAIPLNGTTSLSLTINNPNTTLAFTGLAFNDAFPAGIVVAATPNLTNTCGGTATAAAGTTAISLSAGTLAATATCTVSLDVEGTSAGVKNNSAFASSTEGGAGGTSTASLTVGAPPVATKVFGATSIPLNGTTSLTLTINNPNAGLAFSGLSFTDAFPAGIAVAATPNLSNTCGGTATAAPGAASVSLAAGTLAAGATCTVSLDVQGVGSGVQNNSVSVSAAESGAGNTATASITVAAPPTISKAFGAASIPLNGSTSLSFTINNPNPSTALTGVGFTDTLPAGLVISTPNGLTGSCGAGTITATGGAGVVSLSGATLAAGGSCTFSVSVTGTTGGGKNNVTGSVTSAEGGVGSTAAATLAVVAPPTIGKAFNPTAVAVNGTSVLTLTITNPATNASALTGVAVTDILPAGLVVATPNALANTCGGTAAATAGSGSVSLTGGTLAAGSSCTLTVNITGTTGGNYTNTTGPVSSTEGGIGTTASAGLTVGAAPGITKTFGAVSIALGDTTSLSFTITNPNTTLPLNNVSVTDTLPAGLVIATPNGLTGSCGGGTITASAGSSSLSLSGGTLASLGSCTFAVNVTGSTAGTKNNTTGPISSTESGPGATSNTASLVVVAPPTIAQAFGATTIPLNATTSLTFDLGNPNAGTTLTGIGFTETLPTGLAVASGTVGACGGTVSTTPPGTITLAGATLAPSGTCTFAVTVTGVVAGVQNATSGNVASVEGGLGGTANASVSVVAPPTISKAFGATTITPGGTTTLSFTLRNPAPNTLPITGLSFNDAFPAGMLVATPNGLVGSCGGRTITATAGSGAVSLSGATLAAGETCIFTIDVVITGHGLVTNTTGPVTSSEGGSGGSATASIAAGDVSIPTLTAAGLTLFGLLLALLGLAVIRGRLAG